jgi:NAD(P)-dependent dehydrogenase (short-subunit alcohol dehydrogenase family)
MSTTNTAFRDKPRALVIGGSGGIGAALAEQARHSALFDAVITTGRQRGDITLDLTDTASIRDGLARAAGDHGLDCIIIATGILHEGDIQPEKTMKTLDRDAMRHVLNLNTVGPALVMAAAMEHLPRRERAVVAALSARVGSISDNRLGGWVSYRASKAALNQVIRTTAVEWKRLYKGTSLIGLHPGTVDTGLSEPFQGNVPDGKLFTPEQSASQLWQVIAAAGPEQSGRCFDYAGDEIAP